MRSVKTNRRRHPQMPHVTLPTCTRLRRCPYITALSWA